MTREPKCAEWARLAVVDPVGTAGSYTGYVLIEWPLPWPRDIREVSALHPLVAALRGSGLRLQAVYAPRSRDGHHHVMVYRQPSEDGWSRTASGVERLVPMSTLVDEAIDLVVTNAGHIICGVDVLVCGHGRRDVCCGSKGLQLLSRLHADGELLGDVRLWRTSHLAGHRFTPTAVILPEATAWAYLDERALAAIVRRDADLRSVCARYRGCSALPSAAAQAVERAVLVEQGWSLLDCHRRATQLEPGRLQFDVRGADGNTATWHATLTDGRHIPVPQCGEPPATATEYVAEVIVASLDRVAWAISAPIEKSLLL